MTDKTEALPPLPKPEQAWLPTHIMEFYTADQMRDYARAALAQRQQVPAKLQRLRDALLKIADWHGAWGPYPENNEAWRAMAIVTAREAVPALTAAPSAQAEKAPSKSERVHALVNDSPFAGMSEAFDFHMGADCWTDPAYRPDAATWAAAWKAALRNNATPPAAQAEPQVPLDIAAIRAACRAEALEEAAQRCLKLWDLRDDERALMHAAKCAAAIREMK